MRSLMSDLLPDEEIILRPYQVDAVENLRRSFMQGNRRLLLQAGTGSGKTIIASEIIKSAVTRGRYVLFLAHRRELIDQCADKLVRFGVPHGIIMAGRQRSMGENVQVGSVQTITTRAVKSKKMPLPPVDLLVLDECHRSLSKSYLHLIDYFTQANDKTVVLGMTATPVRGDGRGLGEVYEDMITCPSIRELTSQGFLVPIRYFAPSAPDLDGVHTRMGDYVEKELEERMDKTPLIGNIVENWGRFADGRQTVVFATGVKHSIHITEEFQKAGVQAAHIDGNTPDSERETILTDLWKGNLSVVSNCMVLTEGWDCPPVSCCILARPTKSIGLYLQMCGRTLRPWQGKDDCLLVDHSGSIYTHGFVDGEIPWDLDARRKIQERIQDTKKKESKPITCPECKFVFISLAECPECGWKPKVKGQEYHWIKGELVEVNKEIEFRYSQRMRRDWFKQLLWVADEKGYKRGWVGHTFKKKFKTWPRGMEGARMEPPGPEVRAFIRHLQIRYAKGKAKAAERKQNDTTNQPTDQGFHDRPGEGSEETRPLD